MKKLMAATALVILLASPAAAKPLINWQQAIDIAVGYMTPTAEEYDPDQPYQMSTKSNLERIKSARFERKGPMTGGPEWVLTIDVMGEQAMYIDARTGDIIANTLPGLDFAAPSENGPDDQTGTIR